MSTRSFRPLIALAAAALSLALVGSAVAQEEEASSAPVVDAAAEREAIRAERKALRDERKVEVRAARETRRAGRASDREERKAARTALKAARREVRADCAAQLKVIRQNDELDRASRREALFEARTACKAMLAAARDEVKAAATAPHTTAIDDLYTVAASDGTGVVRTDLGIAEPGSAPGEELGLWHYLIPAQTDLPPHTHPGWQLARVTDGELEYTVIEGEGILLRGDESEPMGPGTYVLATGDGVIENPALIHEASNRGDEPVTIISATLFPAGAEISTLVEERSEEPMADETEADQTEEASDAG